MGCDNCNDNRPHNIPDDCESSQPFCDPCAEDSSCVQKFDMECIFYHFNNSNKASKLTCLGINNNTSLEAIIEKLDGYICNSFNIPFSGQDSNTIAWTAGGPAGHEPSADVKLSNDGGQILEERSNGLFAETDGKVKVSSDDTADYLANQIGDGISASGDITITIVNDGGILRPVPSLNLEILAPLICDMCGSTASPSGGINCANIQEYGVFTLGTPSSGLLQIPIEVTGSGQVTVTATVVNESFYGSTTQTINSSTTLINLPIFYNGLGSDGTQTITIEFSGTQNTLSCSFDVDVASSESCTPVSIAGSPSLPDGIAGVAYSYVIGLNGTAPFSLTDIIKPSWMTINVVGGTIEFGGTPSGSDIGSDLPVSFTVNNCVSDTADFSDTIDVNNTRVTSTMAGTTISGTYGGFTFGPMSPGGEQIGQHAGFTGQICVTVGGTISVNPSNLTLHVNGVQVECIPVTATGVYCFSSATYTTSDFIEIFANVGSCS